MRAHCRYCNVDFVLFSMSHATLILFLPNIHVNTSYLLNIACSLGCRVHDGMKVRVNSRSSLHIHAISRYFKQPYTTRLDHNIAACRSLCNTSWPTLAQQLVHDNKRVSILTCNEMNVQNWSVLHPMRLLQVG